MVMADPSDLGHGKNIYVNAEPDKRHTNGRKLFLLIFKEMLSGWSQISVFCIVVELAQGGSVTKGAPSSFNFSFCQN